jgi:hypothetical protein
VFYFSKSGQLTMVNRTTTTSWTAPYVILRDDIPKAGNLVGLDTFIYGGNGKSAVRVVYASVQSGVRLIGVNNSGRFGDGFWTGQSDTSFASGNTTDPDSGIGANFYASTLQIFTRNNATGALNQFYTVFNMTSGAGDPSRKFFPFPLIRSLNPRRLRNRRETLQTPH